MVVCVVNEKKKVVVVNTDGACRGNPGPGGWGAILEWGDVNYMGQSHILPTTEWSYWQ